MKKTNLDTETRGTISRRGFLTAAAAMGGAAALSGMAGCAPSATPTASTGTPGETSGETEGVGAETRATMQELNPQDYDYTSNTTDMATLFSGWKFGPLELTHRMVKSGAGSSPSPQLKDVTEYYRNFAKGGVEMIWVEDFVDMYEHFPIGMHQPKEVGTPTLQSIIEAVHAEGAYIGYQLSTMGASFSGFDAATAPQYSCAVAGDLTHDEVVNFQTDMGTAAKYLKDLGFDAVEINAAGNNLGQSFMSRMRNHRDDEFGPQSLENRARFISGMIENIKRECGDDFPVQVLINAVEENDQQLGDNASMTTVAENIEMVKFFENAGADSLHVRLGPLGMHVCQFASDLYFSGYGMNGTTAYGTLFDFDRHWEGKLIANHSGCGMLLDVAKEFKDAVSIPVGAVTYMDPAHAPDFFEQALKDGKADFLLMNRPLTVDPSYVNKLREGRIDEIAPCTRCMHCHFDKTKTSDMSFTCRVNACTSRAFTDQMPEGYELPPAEAVKKVVVVGAGPAGMEAARVAALRGHEVTIFEKSGSVGGLLDFASAVKGPHENLDILRSYLERQLEVTGVNVVTGTEADAATIKEQSPDVVVLACGGVRDTLGLQGTEATPVFAMADFMAADLGGNITIVGANAQAVDTAMYLQAQGKNVSMVFPDPLEELSKGHSNWVKTFTKPVLFARGMHAWPLAEIISVGDGEITIASDKGVDVTIPCDGVIEAMDMLPNTGLASELSGLEVYTVGDCEAPWNIMDAITSGNLAGRAI